MLQIETTSVADRIEEMLERQILVGELRADDRLPSFSQLGREFGCHPQTVAVAITRLEAKGLVRRERGIGYLVVDLLRSADLAVFISLIRVAREPSRRFELTAQLLGVLKPILRDISERAALHGSVEYLRWFDSALDVIVSRIGQSASKEDVGRAEMDLLRILSAAAGNAVYTVFFNSLWSLFVPHAAFPSRDTLFDAQEYAELGRLIGLRQVEKASAHADAMVARLENICVQQLRALGWVEEGDGRVFKPVTDPLTH